MPNAMRPVVFVDFDDVLMIHPEFTSYQVRMLLKTGEPDSWPELWNGLVFDEGRRGIEDLHRAFNPWFVISSSWASLFDLIDITSILRRTALDCMADNLHDNWRTPQAPGAGRVTEIGHWIERHLEPGQPVLAIDDHESGWSLHDCALDRAGCVVLCEAWKGFTVERQATARALLARQIMAARETSA